MKKSSRQKRAAYPSGHCKGPFRPISPAKVDVLSLAGSFGNIVL